MRRIKSLNWYQKGVLIFSMIMVLVFTVLYSMTIARVGFEYKNTILIPKQENDSIVYSGKIQGEQARITVFADKKVEFQYDNKTYGPYIVVEDPTAIPKDQEMEADMIGVEVRNGENILFRGGLLKQAEFCLLYNEDGTMKDTISFGMSNGVEIDEDGNIIDPMEPSIYTILDLIYEPELTHKGSWSAWFFGVAGCILTIISILFVDEMFRWKLWFQIRDAERAEPSDWEIVSRYVEWTVLAIMAMAIFILGLQ